MLPSAMTLQVAIRLVFNPICHQDLCRADRRVKLLITKSKRNKITPSHNHATLLLQNTLPLFIANSDEQFDSSNHSCNVSNGNVQRSVVIISKFGSVFSPGTCCHSSVSWRPEDRCFSAEGGSRHSCWPVTGQLHRIKVLDRSLQIRSSRLQFSPSDNSVSSSNQLFDYS